MLKHGTGGYARAKPFHEQEKEKARLKAAHAAGDWFFYEPLKRIDCGVYERITQYRDGPKSKHRLFKVFLDHIQHGCNCPGGLKGMALLDFLDPEGAERFSSDEGT